MCKYKDKENNCVLSGSKCDNYADGECVQFVTDDATPTSYYNDYYGED